MRAMLCYLLPPVLMLLLWNKLADEDRNISRNLARYAVGTLLLNFLCLGAVMIIADSSIDLSYRLNTYDDFAFKYLLLSICLATGLPLLVYYSWHKTVVRLELPDKKGGFRFWRLIGIIYVIVLLLLYIPFLSNNNFWGDECFSLRLSKQSFGNMLESTANDVHPPLYYAILQLMCLIFGDIPFAYNFTSFLPLVITLCFAMTVIWNHFGKESAFLFATLASLLSNALSYNREIRMYSWGALFVLLSFYFLLRILKTNNTIHYVLFVLFSLCAAYTHYYCIITVAFFYLALLVMIFMDWKRYITKVLISCVATVVGYLPWLTILLKTFEKNSESFWLTTFPDFQESTHFLFQSKHEGFLLVAFWVLLFVFLLKELQIVILSKTEDKKLQIHIKLRNITLSAEALWVCAGVLGVFGTILVGVVVSTLFRPLYLTRYLYPAAVVAWLILSISISKLKGKQFLCLVLVLAVLIPGLSAHSKAVQDSKASNAQLESTLAATQDRIQKGDTIYTNAVHIAWTIAAYYYPGVSCQRVDFRTCPKFDPDSTSWVILTDPISAELQKAIVAQSFTCENVVSNGVLGTHNVYVYQIHYTEGV